MRKFLVGNAPCSWGTLEFEGTGGGQTGFAQMLDELAETGYTGTELGDWGYMPTDPAALRAELHRRELVMLGAFVPDDCALFRPCDGHRERSEDGTPAARGSPSPVAIPCPG